MYDKPNIKPQTAKIIKKNKPTANNSKNIIK